MEGSKSALMGCDMASSIILVCVIADHDFIALQIDSKVLGQYAIPYRHKSLGGQIF
jgi:hypothetical protein